MRISPTPPGAFSGMFTMIREDIGEWLAWGIFVPMALVSVVVAMSQASAMVEGVYGAVGQLPPAGGGPAVLAVTVVMTAVTLAAAVLGGYKRVEKIMTALLLIILASFIVVAIKGLLDWRTWVELARGLVPQIPAPEPVFGTARVRDGLAQVMGIAGQALPPAVFWKTVQNLGVIWGLFSVVVIVAGATALHAVYTGAGPAYLGVSHYSQIESIPVAGQVLGPAFPGALRFLAPRFFSLGLVAAGFTTLISVALTMTYFCMDMWKQDWHFTPRNTRFRNVFGAWIAIPALVAPFWQLPALLKAILAMVGNLLIAPAAVLVIRYFVNQRQLGEFKAGAGRNVVLGVTALFSVVLVINGVLGFFK